MSQVPTPIQGTKKPKHSQQAIIRRRHRCRRLASSVVLIVRRHQRRSAPPPSPDRHQQIIDVGRHAAGRPLPPERRTTADAGRAACRSISHAHRCPRAPQSERGYRRSPQRSRFNRLPSRATPYLAPAAGTIITATPLARASRQRRWLTLPNSADRSVSQVPTPIQGTKKPKHSQQAIIRRRHRCRRLASSVVLIVRRHQRRSAPPPSPDRHQQIIDVGRHAAGRPLPPERRTTADAGRAACRSISHAHRCPRAPQSERGYRRSPQRSRFNRLPSRATPYLAPAAGTIITATPLARASRQRRWLTLPNSADRSVSQVPTPIQGTKKPKHSQQAIIRRRHRCRRLASSVVLIVRRHQRRSAPPPSPDRHQQIIDVGRHAAGRPLPPERRTTADAGRAACRSISHAHRCPRAPQSERGYRRSPQRSRFNRLPSRATPYLAPAAGTIITATPLARASRQRRWLTLSAEPRRAQHPAADRRHPVLAADARRPTRPSSIVSAKMESTPAAADVVRRGAGRSEQRIRTFSPERN